MSLSQKTDLRFYQDVLRFLCTRLEPFRQAHIQLIAIKHGVRRTWSSSIVVLVPMDSVLITQTSGQEPSMQVAARLG